MTARCIKPQLTDTHTHTHTRIRTHLPLEKQQHGIHDPHDEVRRLLQLPHRGDVCWFDGLWRQRQRPQVGLAELKEWQRLIVVHHLQGSLRSLQRRFRSLQFGLCDTFISFNLVNNKLSFVLHLLHLLLDLHRWEGER